MTIITCFIITVLKNCGNNLIGKAPLLYKTGVGKYNLDGQLVQEYSSKMDCYTQSTLTKAIRTGQPYNNYIYKVLYDKLLI